MFAIEADEAKFCPPSIATTPKSAPFLRMCAETDATDAGVWTYAEIKLAVNVVGESNMADTFDWEAREPGTQNKPLNPPVAAVFGANTALSPPHDVNIPPDAPDGNTPVTDAVEAFKWVTTVNRAIEAVDVTAARVNSP